MNTTNKALIALLAIQGLLAVVMLGRMDSARLTEAKQLVPYFVAGSIERIEIFRGVEGHTTGEADTQNKLVLAKKNGIWSIESHFDYPVDPGVVEALLDKVTRLSSRGPIAEGFDRQQQLSVADDKYMRKVVLHSNSGAEPLVLYIGAGAGGRKSSVRVGGTDDIHAIMGFGASSAQYAVSAWMDTRYFEVEQNDIVAMTIENAAGTFSFERTEAGAWKLAGDTNQMPPEDASKPGEKRALDQRIIDNAARSVSLLKVNEPADPVIPRGSPLARVTIRVIPGADAGRADSSAAVEHVITIGPEWNGMYIINRDQAPPVLIHFNHLEPVVALSANNLYRTVQPLGAPAEGAHPGGQPASPGAAHAPHGGAAVTPGHGHTGPGAPHGHGTH